MVDASLLGGVLLAVACSAAEPPAEGGREQIGEVLGKPVYRDEIRTEKGLSLRSELHRLFTAPVMEKYRQAHRDEIEPTDEELKAAVKAFGERRRKRIEDEAPKLRAELAEVEEQLAREGLAADARKSLEARKQALEGELKLPGRFFADFLLGNWKFQRHLYDRYGGGRVLWQQEGMEAFDAMRTWLEAQEKQGEFKIADPKLRATFYEYWTTQNHGSFLIEDPARIKSEFLEPEWAAKRTPQK
jgi:hypothetical protein